MRTKRSSQIWSLLLDKAMAPTNPIRSVCLAGLLSTAVLTSAGATACTSAPRLTTQAAATQAADTQAAGTQAAGKKALRDKNGFRETLQVERRARVEAAASKSSAKKKAPAKTSVPKKPATKRVSLELNGSGLCEYGIFSWDIYHGALYLEKPTRNAKTAIDSTQHKVIILRFCRSLSASQLRSAWNGAFKANAGKDLAKYQKGLKRLNAWMKPIAKGEELRFVIRPGRGVEVLDRGVSRGEILSDAWARMFVRLYLGEAPPDKNLRKGMLRGPRKVRGAKTKG